MWEIGVNILVRSQILAWVGKREERTDNTEGPPDAIVYEGPGLLSESNDIALPYAVLGGDQANGTMAIAVPISSVTGAVCEGA